jgi:hypothetical protein
MLESPAINLDRAALLADLNGALATLGAELSHREWKDLAPNGRVVQHRSVEGKLPSQHRKIHARFVHQGLVELAKKAFVKEIEVGVSDFDDHIYVATDTRQTTAELIAIRRVQQALMLLVGQSGEVDVEDGVIQVEQTDPSCSLDEARAEVIALLAHL